MSGSEVVGVEDVAFFQEGPGILSSQYTKEGYPIINVGNVRDGSLDLSKTKFVSEEMANGKWAHFRVEAEDILFTTSGTIGRVARVKKKDLPLLMNTSVVIFRPLDQKQLDSNYLYYILQSALFVDELLKMKTGMAQFNVGPSHIKQLKIPVPSLKVQKQMVEEMKKEEEIIEANKRLITVMESKIEAVLNTI